MIHKANLSCSPEEAGYDKNVLDRIDSHFLDCMNRGLIQGAAYLMSRRGKIFAHRSMGKHSAIEDKGDLMPDCIRPIASITKVFTTTAILQLLERGKLILNQSVSHFIKEFDTNMHRKITIFNLLTHTSGLKPSQGLYLEPYLESWESTFDKEDWIVRFLAGPLRFKPGTQWSYCSKGFALLAEIVARISGMDFDEYIVENILKPLGLEDTFFFCPDEKKDRVAVTKSEWNQHARDEKKSDIISSSLLGGGGLLSTLTDLQKFGEMMLGWGTYNGQRILGRKTVENAIRPHFKDIISYCWQPDLFEDKVLWTCGLGWELNKHNFLPPEVYDHEGADGSGLFIDPNEDFMFIGFYPDEKYSSDTWANTLAIAWSGII